MNEVLSSVFDRIKATENQELTEEEIVNLFGEDLLNHYDTRIRSLSDYVYGHQSSMLGYRAFREWARVTLCKGVYTFNTVYEHHKVGRDLNPYLLRCLTRLGKNIKLDIASQKKVNVPTCPACREYGEKSYCHLVRKQCSCPRCETVVEDLSSGNLSSDRKAELQVRKHFVQHSRKGYRCPSCMRFVPNSSLKGGYVSCVYDGCYWFGMINEMESMAHPVSKTNESFLSLDDTCGQDKQASGTQTFKDMVVSDLANADVRMQVASDFENDFSLVKKVLEQQMSLASNQRRSRAIKKLTMYRAFLNIMLSSPDDMVRYLCHLQSRGDVPLQSRIFQEFVKLIENSLPFKILRQGREHTIYDITDPRLNIFHGSSIFEAVIPENRIIKNGTKERYIGGREQKDYGSNLIGLLDDVVDVENEKSYIDEVVSYTFSSIQMSKNVSVGTKVKVHHLSIPAHYEIKGLVQLQRIRSKVVDSVYRRKFGEQRPKNQGRANPVP